MGDDDRWGGAIAAAADLITPMAIRVAATLRVADHIDAGRRTAAELAAVAGADPDALGRVLDHLVTAGVLNRDGETYALTETGARLRDDDPDGVRRMIDLDGALGRADTCVVELLHTVRTGEPAYQRRFGRPFWDDLAADPALSASFDDLMGARLGADAPVIAGTYAWGALAHLVDVGGGDGSLLIAILRAHPGLRGTVVDLPPAAARAATAIAAAGLAGRADAVGGSFFDPLPAGADAYLLSGVLHDWDDADAVRILTRCAEAVRDDGRVLVIEDAIAAGRDDLRQTEGDVRMLAFVRGRDRGLAGLTELAARAGLTPGPVTPVGTRALVELRTAGRDRALTPPG